MHYRNPTQSDSSVPHLALEHRASLLGGDGEADHNDEVGAGTLHVHLGGGCVAVGQALLERPHQLTCRGHAAHGGPLHVHTALLVLLDVQLLILQHKGMDE